MDKIPNIDRIYRYHLLLTVAEFFCSVYECSRLQHFGCAGVKVSFLSSPAASMEGEMYRWGISSGPKCLLCCGFVTFGGGCFLEHPAAILPSLVAIQQAFGKLLKCQCALERSWGCGVFASPG